jgi:hypothetical protein
MGGGLLPEVRLPWPWCMCTTHLESFSLLGNPLALKDLFLGYSYLEGSYEWL